MVIVFIIIEDHYKKYELSNVQKELLVNNRKLMQENHELIKRIHHLESLKTVKFRRCQRKSQQIANYKEEVEKMRGYLSAIRNKHGEIESNSVNIFNCNRQMKCQKE